VAKESKENDRDFGAKEDAHPGAFKVLNANPNDPKSSILMNAKKNKNLKKKLKLPHPEQNPNYVIPKPEKNPKSQYTPNALNPQPFKCKP
jgi:hypothetical protein